MYLEPKILSTNPYSTVFLSQGATDLLYHTAHSLLSETWHLLSLPPLPWIKYSGLSNSFHACRSHYS